MSKKIAFCPTMTPFADNISKSVKEVKMIEMGSAAQVLGALRGGTVDGILIGRYAKAQELSAGTEREIFRGGYTLVYKVKSGISEEQLKGLTIKTYLDKDRLSDFIPLFGSVEYLGSLDECITDGLEAPVLIDWKDYRDDFELLIPLNAGGKVPLFRAPVLYYKDMDRSLIDQIRSAVK